MSQVVTAAETLLTRVDYGSDMEMLEDLGYHLRQNKNAGAPSKHNIDVNNLCDSLLQQHQCTTNFCNVDRFTDKVSHGGGQRLSYTLDDDNANPEVIICVQCLTCNTLDITACAGSAALPAIRTTTVPPT